jgi:hypothetical protein
MLWRMTLDEFQAQWTADAKTPEGAVRLYLLAMLEHLQAKNPQARKMVALGLPKDEVDAQGEPGPGQALSFNQFGRVIEGTNFPGAIAASYLGGTPANGYVHDPAAALVVDEQATRRQDAEVKLFLRSGGKDSPSPVLLKKNKDGHWKIFDASSLFTGVRPAQTNDF